MAHRSPGWMAIPGGQCGGRPFRVGGQAMFWSRTSARHGQPCPEHLNPPYDHLRRGPRPPQRPQHPGNARLTRWRRLLRAASSPATAPAAVAASTACVSGTLQASQQGRMPALTTGLSWAKRTQGSRLPAPLSSSGPGRGSTLNDRRPARSVRPARSAEVTPGGVHPRAPPTPCVRIGYEIVQRPPRQTRPFGQQKTPSGQR